jgi:UDP-GlcNAc3NAcA epimerase
MRYRVVTVIGARPQFIKCAAVSEQLEQIGREAGGSRGISEVIVHTGQHYDDEMSKVFFHDLRIRHPKYNLEVGSGRHPTQTAEMMKRLEPVLLDEAPDMVIVYGDTNSTLAGALASKQLGIPVAHVEAGLRSHREGMAEELNRVIADRVATLRFCPSEAAVDNLLREGIASGVHYVGDVMLDILLRRVADLAHTETLLATLGVSRGEYFVATIHRAENTDESGVLKSILQGLVEVATHYPVILPIHPRTRNRIDEESGYFTEGLTIIPPQRYDDMLALQAAAKGILTDSGGMQKEAYWLGVPCTTLRSETEWPETQDGGWNVLAGTNAEQIVRTALRRHPDVDAKPIYGDGRAARHVTERLLAWLESRVP